MAPNFGRSISFPLTPARSFSKPRHVRSVSLPGTTSSHPLLANIHAHIAALYSWIQQDPSSSLPAGLTAIQALHSSFADLLLLPESRAALRCATGNAADRLLDAFLLLADAHQGFQDAVLEIRHAAAESRTALRRGDPARLALAARSQRKSREGPRPPHRICLRRLQQVRASEPSHWCRGGRDGQRAREGGCYQRCGLGAVFSAAASMSSPASSCKKMAMFIPAFATRKATGLETVEAAMKRLHALERCFNKCDGACDRVFRSVVQTRVSLLNIMTPTI